MKIKNFFRKLAFFMGAVSEDEAPEDNWALRHTDLTDTNWATNADHDARYLRKAGGTLQTGFFLCSFALVPDDGLGAWRLYDVTNVTVVQLNVRGRMGSATNGFNITCSGPWITNNLLIWNVADGSGNGDFVFPTEAPASTVAVHSGVPQVPQCRTWWDDANQKLRLYDEGAGAWYEAQAVPV